MEKEVGQIRYVETDNGLRVEISGEAMKKAVACCGLPALGCCPTGAPRASQERTDCCRPENAPGKE